MRKHEMPGVSQTGLILSVFVLGVLLTALTSCGFSGSVATTEAPVALRGSVRGGHQPVSGSSIQLYAAGITGTASAAKPLLSNPVQSDSNGNFFIPASYECPSASSETYLVAQGGNPGSGSTNANLTLMAVLGTCGSLSPINTITINEVTTVGSVWPLAVYLGSATNLGSSSSDTAFESAALSVSEFININNGSSPGTPTAESYFAENSKLYSLADVLDKCVNSAGGSAGDGTPCGVLFATAAPVGGRPPTDIISAAIRIAQNPGNEVSAIFGMVAAPSAFIPALTATPADWALTLSYPVATPSISLPSGTYVSDQEATITDATAGSKIYYTTDGTTPTTSATLYSGALSIGVSTDLQAIAVWGGTQSAVAASTVTITATPVGSHLVFLQQPSNALEGASISPAVSVAIKDANGNTVAAAASSVTLALAGGTGLMGTLTVGAQNGVANFPTVSVTSPGTAYSLVATSPGLTATSSTSFTVSLPGIALSLPASSIVVGNTVTGSLTLSAPAASGGVSIDLASASANNASVSPSIVAIAAGQKSGSFLVSGVAVGSSSISATATNYNSSSVPVTVSAAVPTGPTVNTVESLGAIPVSQAVNGLGFNVSPGNDWEFQMAAAAGATHARYQCSWVSTEIQTAPPANSPASPQFALQSDCQAGLVSAANAGIHSTIVAAYGSPFHRILAVTVPGGAAAGATTVQVQFASGVGGDTLSAMQPYYDTILSSSNASITKKHSYAGGLVTGVTLTDSAHASLTLASALSTPLPANTTTQYLINQYLYPPPATFSPSDPSVLAYAGYAEFLAGKISASGVTGEVEIWNEPPWSDDPWDDRYDFYDNQPVPINPGPQSTYLPDWGFAAVLQAQASAVSGVTYNWGGTEKSGFNSMLDSQMLTNTGVLFKQPNTLLTTESFHPYGNDPEDSLWSQPCLIATIGVAPAPAKSFSPCNFAGVGPNIAFAAQLTLIQQSFNPAWGIGHNITETGFSGTSGDDQHKARFVMRQFLGYQAAGVTPIQFYRLFDTSADNFSFVNPTANADGTHTPLPAYNAIAGLMSDLGKIKSAPVAPYVASSLPSIASYQGTYPLDTVSLVGSRAGASGNSILFALWQRSNTTGVWGTLASPIPATVTIQLPSGIATITVINLDTRVPVSYTTSVSQITFAVSDDPIEVLLEP